MSVVKVKRRKRESFEGLFRRFNQRVYRSGKTLEARKIRFYEKDPNRSAMKASALRRMRNQAQYEYLLKTGQLPSGRRGRRRRR